jgi:hypothetical protein
LFSIFLTLVTGEMPALPMLEDGGTFAGVFTDLGDGGSLSSIASFVGSVLA